MNIKKNVSIFLIMSLIITGIITTKVNAATEEQNATQGKTITTTPPAPTSTTTTTPPAPTSTTTTTPPKPMKSPSTPAKAENGFAPVISINEKGEKITFTIDKKYKITKAEIYEIVEGKTVKKNIGVEDVKKTGDYITSFTFAKEGMFRLKLANKYGDRVAFFTDYVFTKEKDKAEWRVNGTPKVTKYKTTKKYLIVKVKDKSIKTIKIFLKKNGKYDKTKPIYTYERSKVTQKNGEVKNVTKDNKYIDKTTYGSKNNKNIYIRIKRLSSSYRYLVQVTDENDNINLIRNRYVLVNKKNNSKKNKSSNKKSSSNKSSSKKSSGNKATKASSNNRTYSNKKSISTSKKSTGTSTKNKYGNFGKKLYYELKSRSDALKRRYQQNQKDKKRYEEKQKQKAASLKARDDALKRRYQQNQKEKAKTSTKKKSTSTKKKNGSSLYNGGKGSK